MEADIGLTSVLPRLMVRPKRRDASANLLMLTCRSGILMATRAQSSANSTSRTILYTVFGRQSSQVEQKAVTSVTQIHSMLETADEEPENKRQHASFLDTNSNSEGFCCSAVSPPERTFLVMSSWNCLIRLKNLAGHPNLP